MYLGTYMYVLRFTVTKIDKVASMIEVDCRKQDGQRFCWCFILIYLFTNQHCTLSNIYLMPFSHDEKKTTFLAKFSQCLRNITKWASCERTVMFYMSYIPCEIFANIEKFCRRSGPTTKSYASVIFRTEPCSLPRVKRSLFIDRRSMRKRSYRARVMTLRARPFV